MNNKLILLKRKNNKSLEYLEELKKICIKNGKITLVVDGVAFTLYSHNELVNAIRWAFPDEWHDVTTIIETLLYIE